MPQTRPTGFCDLPLELRQMIYDDMLPADRVIYFCKGKQRSSQKAINALCRADAGICQEIIEWMYKDCVAHIKVRPHEKIGLPSIKWNRFKRIVIEIDYYEERSGDERWPGMIEVVDRLRKVDGILPEITIYFREDDFDPDRTGFCFGDEKWTKKVPPRTFYRFKGHRRAYGQYKASPVEHEDIEDTWLRTTGDDYANPIAVEILDYFLDLPACKSAEVYPLHGLEDRRVDILGNDPRERIFDEDYMDDLCHALTTWLKGERDGIVLPAGISEYGEPRLEQLAYQRYKGRRYHETGLSVRAMVYRGRTHG